MNFLVLGGTVFVGRGIAEAALERGHDVTVFHRGTKGTGLIPGATEILGDRDGQLDRLADGQWDFVVDACGYVPRLVEASAKAAREFAHRYLFISTISVFEEDDEGGLRVQEVASPVGTEVVDATTYGALKVECERAVRRHWGEKATIVRPGLVYGPHDPTGRFGHWVQRFMDGGRFLVPDVMDAPLQQIDARDLGTFVVRLLEDDRRVTIETAGDPTTVGEMFAHLSQLFPEAQPVKVSPEKIKALGLDLGQDFPLLMGVFAPPFMRVSNEAAVAAGMPRRPFDQTALDTAAWLRETPAAREFGKGIRPEREAEILAELG